MRVKQKENSDEIIEKVYSIKDGKLSKLPSNSNKHNEPKIFERKKIASALAWLINRLNKFEMAHSA